MARYPAPQLALVTTLHDPDSRLLPLAEPLVEGWLARFAAVLVFTSPEGAGETGAMLAGRGVRCIEDREPQGVEQMGSVRLRALRSAGEHPFYFLVDFDRLLHWEQHFPDELARAEQQIARQDFLLFGRTHRAFETHPHVQRETERLANEAFHAVAGRRMDITAGARGLSAAGRAALLQHSRCTNLGVDGEWPLLCQRLGLSVGYLETEGLEWETADRFADQIGEMGYERWLREQVNTPQQWETRLRIAWQIARAAREASERSH